MFQVLAPDRLDLHAARERLRRAGGDGAELLPPGERWYQLGPREQAADRQRLQLTPERSRWVTRTPPNPSMLQHVVAAASTVVEAEAKASVLAARMGCPLQTVVWRLGNWSTNLPSIHPYEVLRQVARPEGPWTWLGRWVAGLCASEDPIHAALVELLRTGVGIDAVHQGTVSLFLPDGSPPPVFAADHPPSMRGLQAQLDRALRAGSEEGVRAALLRGADPVAGYPPALVRALEAPAEHRRALLSVLLDAGADPERVGWAALPYHALLRDGLDDLLAVGVTIDARGPDGTTALHTAIRYRLNQHVQTLLERGADPDLADVRGWTPLHEAMAIGNDQAQVLLIEHGARNLPDRAGVGASEPGERPVPPPRPEPGMPARIATAPLPVFADWLEAEGDPRGAWIQRALTGEDVPQLREEGLRRIAALHPVLAAHCTAGMVQLEHGFATVVRSRSAQMDAGALQLLLHPEGARVKRARLCSVDGLDEVTAPCLRELELVLEGPATVQLGLPELQRLTVRGCPSLAVSHPTLPWLAVRMPLQRETPLCPIRALDLPALRTLDLELPWVPDAASLIALEAALADVELDTLVVQPVNVALIESLLAWPVLRGLKRLELRSLRADGVQAVLARLQALSHLELVLTVLDRARSERVELQRELRASNPGALVRGETYRSEGGYANR